MASPQLGHLTNNNFSSFSTKPIAAKIGRMLDQDTLTVTYGWQWRHHFLEQACGFSGFYRNSGFLKHFCRKIHFSDQVGEWGVLLFTFVLLNRSVPDVETIYFVSIEQKK